jgi:type IV secretion system protein VirB6
MSTATPTHSLIVPTKGFRILTGQSREPMIALVASMSRNALIVIAASTMALGGSDLHSIFTNGLLKEVNYMVTGEKESPVSAIDNAQDLNVSTSGSNVTSVSMSSLVGALGVSSPAIMAGTLLLTYQVGLALFISMGPLFILCLLFEQTKSLFSRWLFYGIGTLFSLAVLSVMVELSTRMVGAVAISILGKYAALATASSLTDSLGLGDISSALTSAMGGNDGITSMAMQQGGLGLVLSTLIISAPPMAANFFQGTLGQFAAQNSFGYLGSQGQGARQQAAAMGQPAAPPTDNGTSSQQQTGPSQPHPTGRGTTSTAGAHSDTIGTAPVPQARQSL